MKRAKTTAAASRLRDLPTETWLASSLAEQFRWFEAKGTTMTPEQREAYEAGFAAGWRAMRSTLLLHLDR